MKIELGKDYLAAHGTTWRAVAASSDGAYFMMEPIGGVLTVPVIVTYLGHGVSGSSFDMKREMEPA